MSNKELEVCAYDSKDTSLRGLCDAALAASKAHVDAPTTEAEYEAWNCLQDMRWACDAKTMSKMLNETDTLRAENARLREVLQETCNALHAGPPFNYARSGSPVKSSKQTLKQARAALEVKP